MNDTQFNRNRYIEVIVEMLKEANVEKLHIVWTFVSVYLGKRKREDFGL